MEGTIAGVVAAIFLAAASLYLGQVGTCDSSSLFDLFTDRLQIKRAGFGKACGKVLHMS
jgi:hypothetical protein